MEEKPSSDGKNSFNKCCLCLTKWIKDGENLLLILTKCGVILGVILGVLLRGAGLDDTTIMLIAFPGNLLMNMLKMVILPMIICSIVASILHGLKVPPGRWATLETKKDMDYSWAVENGAAEEQPKKETLDMMLDFFRHLIPDNIFRALLAQEETILLNNTDGVMERTSIYVDSPNVLGVVLFSIVFGLSAAAIGINGEPTAKLFISLNEVITKLVDTVMWALPVGVISLVAGSILELKSDPIDMLSAISIFLATTFVAQTIHFYITLPIVFFLLTRGNPYKFILNQLPAFANVLGHSSSSAALPVTTYCLVSRNHVDPRVAKFVLPVGAAVNIDGAAVYEALAAVFVSQMHHMGLGWGQALAVIVTITMSSVGSSGLPGAGLVSVLPILSPIPITSADVAMLLVTDWLVDRYRTCSNVMADSMAAGAVAHLCKAQLAASQHVDIGTEPTDGDVILSAENVEMVNVENGEVVLKRESSRKRRASSNKVAPVSRF